MTDKRRILKSLGFSHIIVRRTNMGVLSPGAIESAFCHKMDADRECEHLCRVYATSEEDFPAFEVEKLNA